MQKGCFIKMKKIIAIILALILIMLCTTGCARGNQVKHYVDETTLEVQLYPSSANGETFASGLTALQVVMNTPNVELAHGEIVITRVSDGKEIAKYDARMDTDSIYLNSGNNPPYAQLIIMLPEGECFEMGESYSVTMDEKFFYIDDVHGFIGDYTDEWEFTIGNYGYNGNISEMPTTYLVGDVIEIPVAIADEAATAILLYDNVSVVSSDLRALSESGTFALETIHEGKCTISVMFLKEDGTHLETLGFTVTVK